MTEDIPREYVIHTAMNCFLHRRLEMLLSLRGFTVYVKEP
jgi:hypothetical protein